MAQESKFLECDQDRAQLFYTQHPRDDSEEAQRFTRKARQLLVKGKEVLDALGVRFWLSSGTCLGMSLHLSKYVTLFQLYILKACCFEYQHIDLRLQHKKFEIVFF